MHILTTQSSSENGILYRTNEFLSSLVAQGALTDGTVFDESYGRGEPIDFELGAGRVIKGWFHLFDSFLHCMNRVL